MDDLESLVLDCFPDDIEDFFTQEEYSAMSEDEKLTYKNIRVHYEMMIAVGKMWY